MDKSHALGTAMLSALIIGASDSGGTIKGKGKPARLRNKTAHGIARKVKNKAARKGRLRNR